MFNFSIIIPHKNIPELLERCLASIPVRDDVQVIVVDDSSDSKIVDFAHFPGRDRPNTELIFHKSTIGGVGGAGYARNCGLEVARGRWVVFADADDFFHTDAVSAAFDKYADTEEVDMVFFPHDSVDNATMQPVNINTSRNKFLAAAGVSGAASGSVSAAKLTPETEDNIRYSIWVPWGRFIRREMLVAQTIRFDEVRFSNYVMFSVKAGHAAGQIVVDQSVIYCNVRREGSTIHEGRRDWAAMSQRFDVDYRAAIFAASIGKVVMFQRVVIERWRELSQIDRWRALKLLPALRQVCTPTQIRNVRIEEVMRRFFGKKGAGKVAKKQTKPPCTKSAWV